MNFRNDYGNIDFSEAELKAIDELLEQPSLNKLETEKRRVARKYSLSRFLSNSQIIRRARDRGLFKKHPWIHQLNRKPTRSISGISNVAVMIPPNLGGIKGSCPFNCSYCPSAENAPKSYLGYEPSTLRAIGYDYDPYKIVKGRISQLESIGHPANKIHLILQGGTFLSVPAEVQDRVLKSCFDAIIEQPSQNIEEAIKLMESSKRRLVGLTFETRPDYCKVSNVNRMLSRGGTLIEIGVQTLFSEYLLKVKRGHKIEDVYEANKISRDAGFKMSFHMMPNLYTSPEEDIEMFNKLFKDPRLMPDGLKIYPVLVIKDTQLYNDWIAGEYSPYSDEKLIESLAKIKRELPEFTRIHRIQRDIPTKHVSGGLMMGNLRNLVKEYMDRNRWKCSCIRCREVGIAKNLTGYNSPQVDQLKLDILKFQIADGIEWFFQVVDPITRVLFGFLRMRFPSPDVYRPEITPTTSIIRELHVYGKELRIGELPKESHTQHRGFGKTLISKAEETAFNHGFNEMLVISGIGVREYYKKLGYYQKGPYVAKKLE
ncbi:MAG: tRNA uridine(34) 5-carboxymethylaminomethyl modification radical SAM/GNAT enzyme Elp3 [Candidatus Hodarchaeales archaeon]|jgi:elongator complex protein 3